MKKVKNFILLCVAFVFIAALSACAGEAQGANNPDGSRFAIEDIQDNPASYVGAITLVGIVADSAAQGFVLQSETGSFEVFVEYRGSQALPQNGDRVAVEGQLTENRPCCGPGFTLSSTRFEEV